MPTTINGKKVAKPSPTIEVPTVKETVAPINIDTPENWKPLLLDESKIDFSSRNYREAVTDADVADLAAEMKSIGFMIGPVTVRPSENGRFELAVGERRLRAARIAGIRLIPSIVRELSDEEVDEIQWAENHQRKDPHPMLEARRMAAMLDARRRTVEELAARAGKPVDYVYTRIRLTKLMPAFQEMYLHEILTTKHALLIAGLSVESQQALYEEHGKNWEVQKRVTYYDLDGLISNYKCRLSDAPFDPTLSDLLPDMGACGGCIYNTANKLNQLLFPDQNTKGTCTNMQCFERKCKSALMLRVSKAVAEKEVVGIIVEEAEQATVKADLEKVPGAAELPSYEAGKVTRMEEPTIVKPYLSKKATPQEKKVAKAVVDGQKKEIELFRQRVKEGKILRGLQVRNGIAKPIFFVPELPPKARPVLDPDRMTKQQVLDAIKGKVATPDMINKERSRAKEREKEFQRRDEEIVADEMYQQLKSRMETAMKAKSFTPAPVDLCAMLFMVLNTLPYSGIDEVVKFLWGTNMDRLKGEPVLDKLKGLTDKQRCFLIRFAFLKYDPARQPRNWAHPILRGIAQVMGVDLKAIEKKQAAVAANRQQKAQQTDSMFKTVLKTLTKDKGTKQ